MPRDPFEAVDSEPPLKMTRRKSANGGAPSGGLVVEVGAPYDIARIFLTHQFTTGGDRTLHHHRGEFFKWTGTAYSAVGHDFIRSALYEFLDTCLTNGKKRPKPLKPTRTTVSNVADGLRAAAHLDGSIAAPAWLDHVPDIPPYEIVACTNGLLHLPTLDLIPHTPAFYTHNAVAFAYERDAPEPHHWLAFLNQLWPNDPDSIETLQEIFGLSLTPDTSYQKGFLVVGPKRSGKGTVARVLAQLVGVENTVAPTLAGLGRNFGLAPLIGKRVAVISDARLGGKADQQAVAERLLSVTGEDAITIDRKFLPAWTGQLQTRFIILSNELPRLADTSGALASRFIVLMLTQSFYGREDRRLTARLLTELPGILNWAIVGWRRLKERGYFRQPASAADAVRELEDLGSPITAFIRDCCVVAPGRMVEVTRLFEVWCQWSKEQGRDYTGNIQLFGRDLRSALPNLKTSRPRDDDDRIRMYEGLGLR
jgi:putative DNA primase/helicase